MENDFRPVLSRPLSRNVGNPASTTSRVISNMTVMTTTQGARIDNIRSRPHVSNRLGDTPLRMLRDRRGMPDKTRSRLKIIVTTVLNEPNARVRPKWKRLSSLGFNIAIKGPVVALR